MRETLTRGAWYGLDNGKLAAIVVKKIDLIISVAQFLHGKDHKITLITLEFSDARLKSGLWRFFFYNSLLKAIFKIKLTKVLLTGRHVRQRLQDQKFFVSSTREVTIDHVPSLGRAMTTAN